MNRGKRKQYYVQKNKNVYMTQKCLTYVWQEKASGVVLHKEVLSAHIDSDEDRLALLRVGAVLLVHARDPVSAVIYWAGEGTLTRRTCPVVSTGIHRALSDTVVRNTE